MEELTLVDKKIITLMEYNPRITFRELAKVCNLSKDTIKYRINKLEKEKIILGYTAFIDYKKLGNQSYKLYLKINGSLDQKNALKEYLRKQKNVFAVFESTGNWNLAIAVFAKTHQEFNHIENLILENFGEIIVNRRFCSMMDVEMYQKNFFHIDNKPLLISSYCFWGEVESNTLDSLDKKLAKILNSNSRISLVDLSEELKLSLDAIKNRIKRLKDNKIVSIYKTAINYEKLGYDKYKLLLFPKLYSDKIEQELITFFRSNRHCINSMRTIGPWKIEAEFLISKQQEMEEIIYELNQKFKDNILDLEFSTQRNEELFAGKDLLLE